MDHKKARALRARTACVPDLRFTSLTVTSARADLHLPQRAAAGRTKKKPPEGGFEKSPKGRRWNRTRYFPPGALIRAR